MAGAFAALLPLDALAAFPATPASGQCTVAPCYEYNSSSGSPEPWLRSAESACVRRAATLYTQVQNPRFHSFTPPTLCRVTVTDGGQQIVSGFDIARRSASVEAASYTCPSNSTLSGSSCTCSSNFTQVGSTCVNPGEAHCASIVGSPVKTSWTSTAPSLSTRTVCAGGGSGYHCNATIEPDFCGSSDGLTSVCYGSGVSAAGACTPSPSPETPVSPTAPVTEWPTPPPPGTCPGQVNGVTVNMPCSDTVSKGSKTEATNNGSGTTGTKSESRATTCTAAGSCTTTVTTITSVNGGAPGTSTKTTTETKGEFCVSNPAAKECGDGEGSSFGGSCEAGFVCEGDAVQCAHAKETHLQNCKINKDTPERQLYESSKGDEAEFDNDEVVNVGPASFSQAPILGAASCISDKSITVIGSTVSLPFSRVCQYLSMLGNVLMAVGFLLSGRIIMRG